MKPQIHPSVWLMVAALLLTLSAAGLTLAQSGGGYDLTWNNIDNGTYDLSSGGYTLGATVGQSEAGVLSGGAYTLNEGYQVSGIGNYSVYLPLVIRMS